jgi:cell division septation protein DedD
VRLPATVQPPPPAASSIPKINTLRGRFTVQVGAFKDAASANALVGELGRRFSDVFVLPPSDGESIYRVRVSRGADLASARRLENELRGEGFDTFITTLN